MVVGSAARVAHPLPLRLDLANKSPTGFEWGYGGSGPSQLALALCADALDDEIAVLTIYQNFKSRFRELTARCTLDVHRR